MKGIILAGGTGSRLHPLTRITNKHLLPIYDKPMIFHPIETLVRAGIDEVMVGLCESFAEGDKVVVMLGDNILGESIARYIENFGRQDRGARLLLKQMEDASHLRHLGVPIFDTHDRLAFIREKPENPPSPYAVIGVYMYDAAVFDIVRQLKPSGRGELEVTDVNNAYIDRAEMEYDVISGFWGDAGESIDVYYEVIDYVRAHGVNHPAADLTPDAVLVAQGSG